MIRLFIALNIPDDIKQDIINLRNQAAPQGYEYKWEPVEKFHLTLKYIGNVKESSLEVIKNKISFIEDYKKLNCRFLRFGFFYDHDTAKILWLGFYIDKGIFYLTKRLNKELMYLSIKPEKRKFKPHLTLLRIKRKVDDDFINKFEDFRLPEKEFVADSISLYKSELDPKGSKYTEIRRYNLREFPNALVKQVY